MGQPVRFDIPKQTCGRALLGLLRWGCAAVSICCAACSADDEHAVGANDAETSGLEPGSSASASTSVPMSAPPAPVRMPGETSAGDSTGGAGVSGHATEPSSAGGAAGSPPSSEQMPDFSGASDSDETSSAATTDFAATTSDSGEDARDDTREDRGPGWPGMTSSDTRGDSAQSSTDPSTSDPTRDAGDGMTAQGASGETGRMVGMTAAHNAVRDAVALQSLPPLTWSDEIAAYAQQWADELARDCTPRHRSNLSYGENIASFGNTAASGPGTSARDAVDGWAAEIDCWEYGEFMRTDSCDSACVAQLNASGCGHYTQLVWSATEQVGCGVSQCSRDQGGRTFQFDIWVCNYDPPGNFVGRTPY